MRTLTLLSTFVLALITFTSCEVYVVESTPNVEVDSISKIERTYYETDFWGNQKAYATTDYEIVIENTGQATARQVKVVLIVEDVDGWIQETTLQLDYLYAQYQESFTVETDLSPNNIYAHDVRIEWSH